jgi:hypothetical protein
MKTISLTNSDKLALVDELYYEDVLALGPWRVNRKGYVETTGDNLFGHGFLHNLVMQFFGHDLTGVTVDHRDRNKLDNRRRNLRPATHRQQMMNRGRMRSNTSGFIGVDFHERYVGTLLKKLGFSHISARGDIDIEIKGNIACGRVELVLALPEQHRQRDRHHGERAARLPPRDPALEVDAPPQASAKDSSGGTDVASHIE